MFIQPIMQLQKPQLKLTKAFKSATNVGFSLGISTCLFTSIKDPSLFFLDILMGTYTYGIDREDTDNLFIYDLMFLIISLMLSKNNYTFSFIPIVLLTRYYKYYKKHLNVFKPWFITILWSLCVIVLPYIYKYQYFNIEEHKFNLFAFSFLIYSMTNFEDKKDINDDKLNNINTLAVYLGNNNINYIILFNIFCFIISLFN